MPTEIKISQLPQVTSLAGIDVLPSVAGTVTSKITLKNLADSMPQVPSSVNADSATFASNAASSSLSQNSLQSVSSSYAVSGSYSVSSSFSQRAVTASYALSASFSPDSVSASYALSASFSEASISSSYALSASYAVNSFEAENSLQSVSSSYSISGSYAINAFYATSASQAATSSWTENFRGTIDWWDNQTGSFLPNEQLTVSNDLVLDASMLTLMKDPSNKQYTIGNKTFRKRAKIFMGGDLLLVDSQIVNDGEINVQGGVILSGNSSIVGTGILT